MSDPALSRPPFIPEGTFRCCLCFDVVPVEEAWSGLCFGQWATWDNCRPCGEQEALYAWHHDPEYHATIYQAGWWLAHLIPPWMVELHDRAVER